ncbi:MAG: chromosomal replication initiator protein DnaA [Puniceicoccaceae bacterium]|nr:MAG: chromosomal replication initiator protein DnaA [Puniceicoccaceae bacterium]
MSLSLPAQSLWDSVKTELQKHLPADIFGMWFQSLSCLQADDQALVLQAPSDFAAIWIHDNYLDLIRRAIESVNGSACEIILRRADATEPERPPKSSRKAPAASRVNEVEARGLAACLNPRNTFANFVVGSNNTMAHAAAMAVAQSPAMAYNPLFIYGETGLGKTHLMHAVGHYIVQHRADARVVYLSTEKFTNEFINAIRENSLTRFRQRYRSVDVLLLDDVQFLGGKERIQEEFFHTFNDLFESQKQIFLCSDRPAQEISKLESRLGSRFQWGLTSDIQSPDFETRVAILSAKAAAHGFTIEPELIEYIARRVVYNVRDLQGALIKVCSYSTLTGKPLNLQVVDHLLRDIFLREARRTLNIDIIQKQVADYFQLSISDLIGRRRPANIAIPRQIGMYLARCLTTKSLQEIGKQFGGRDHGTVIHAVRSVENMIEQDESMRHTIEYLKKNLSR